ncbi:hypothetical protein CAAN1_01S05864 [[Candida] anglica]|uniref:Uncharacterized protein n=1 Tax=[Candida] anglica TaxID=148631 RepID=A0ABP0EJP3_9ASCO
MAIQKTLNLNAPLNANTSATLKSTELVPELAEASLTLHGDNYRQRQVRCNRFVFWHPISMTFFTASLVLYVCVQYRDYVSQADSIGEFFEFALDDRDFLFRLFMTLPGIVCLAACVSCVAYFLSDDFRTISDKLPEHGYVNELYGFNLRNYAKLPEGGKNVTTSTEKELLKNGKNSSLLIYRDSPIAIATVKPLLEKSDQENFFVSVTGLHIRKVFAKVDFDDLLLDWVNQRATELLGEYIKTNKKNKGAKVTILVEVFNFEKEFIKTLESKFYSKVNVSYDLNTFPEIVAAENASHVKNRTKKSTRSVLKGVSIEAANKLFGLQKFTYALTVSKKTVVEDIVPSTNDTPLKKRK